MSNLIRGTGIPSVAFSPVARFTVSNYSNNIITHLRKDFKPMKNIISKIIQLLVMPLAFIVAVIEVIREEIEYGK